MENYQTSGHPITAAILTAICLLNGTFAAIINDVELFIRIGAAGMAIISGSFAANYYYYAAKEKKSILKNQKSNNL